MLCIFLHNALADHTPMLLVTRKDLGVSLYLCLVLLDFSFMPTGVDACDFPFVFVMCMCTHLLCVFDS